MGWMPVQGERRHDIVDDRDLTPPSGEPAIDKPGKVPFYSTALDTVLRADNICQLIITGVTSEV